MYRKRFFQIRVAHLIANEFNEETKFVTPEFLYSNHIFSYDFMREFTFYPTTFCVCFFFV